MLDSYSVKSDANGTTSVWKIAREDDESYEHLESHERPDVIIARNGTDELRMSPSSTDDEIIKSIEMHVNGDPFNYEKGTWH